MATPKAETDLKDLKSCRVFQESEEGNLILIEVKQEQSSNENKNNSENPTLTVDYEDVPDNVLRDETNCIEVIHDYRENEDNRSSAGSLSNSSDADYVFGYCTQCTTTYKYDLRKKEKIKKCKKCEIDLKYKCPDCAKLYSSLNHARRHHKFTCNKEPRYPCSQCDYKTTSTFNLNIHIQSKHKPRGPKTNLCYKCGSMYETHRYLLQHEKRCGVSNDRNSINFRYFCDNCDYKCVQKIRIRRHMLHVHVKPDNARCPTCKKVFKLKKYLEMHKVTSSRCAKKALEKIPLSEKNNKNERKKRIQKVNNNIIKEKQKQMSRSHENKVEKVQEKIVASQSQVRKSPRVRPEIDYKNLKKER